ncbi:MAG: PTS transporter subunit EIIC [Brevinema sp.]
MKVNFQKLADSILELVGGKENIISAVNCMTRVRLSLKNIENADLEALKDLEGVIGILQEDGLLQVVVGPGSAQKVRELMENQLSLKDAESMKNEAKAKYGTSLGASLKVLSNIFVPVVPGFIAGGLLLGIANIFKSPLLAGHIGEQFPNIVKLLALMGGAVFFYMNAMIGANTAKESGGTPVMGLIMAAILSHPDLNNISLLGIQFVAGRGGIFAILMAAYFVSKVEIFIRKRMPNSLDIFFTPIVSLLLSTPIVLLVIQPIGGMMSSGIGFGATALLENGGFFSGFILGGAFLPLVMTGIHQGLLPIMTDMLNTYGVNSLLPVLAMAGAGQVGAAFAVLLKTKNTKIKDTAKGALMPGVLGVGEPLIYGVTLPLGKPFLCACFGGAIGGGVISLFKVGALIPGGLSGVLLTAAIVPAQMGVYLFAVLAAYLAGFAATWFIGFEDPKIGGN